MKEVSDWAKAFTLALLDIAGRDHRKFALVHFASINEIQTDRFFPGEYALEDVLRAAEHNFNGGTDFEAPLMEMIRMIGNGFEQADIVFITDGECAVTEGFAERFQEEKQRFGFQVTGILLDKEDSSAGASLIPFCDRIYRSSELTEDAIAIRIFEQSRI